MKDKYFVNDKIPSIISHGITNSHCFMYTINDELYGFGDNCSKQIKNVKKENMKPTLIKYNFDSRIIQIECGCEHSLFLTLNGNVYGSGKNNVYQLTNKYIYCSNTIFGINKIYDNNDIIRIGCAFGSSYLLTKKNTLLSVGSTKLGTLGRSSHINYRLLSIYGNIKVQTFNSGCFHVGCLTLDNSVYMFGHNKYGQLGLNIRNNVKQKPTILRFDKLNDKIVDVRCGDIHTIIKTTNNYYSFGDNKQSQLLIESSLKLARKPILLDLSYIKTQTGFNGDIIDIIPASRTTLVFQKHS